jgi:uncharacterized protein (TIGR02246 family)
MNVMDSPGRTVERFAELIGVGDLDAALDLYEPDAAFIPEPGRVVAGRAAIREALSDFLALRPTIAGTIRKQITAGDTALVVNDWSLRGTAPDGGEVTMAATSADVLRRRNDGSWAILIDDPWGVD